MSTQQQLYRRGLRLAHGVSAFGQTVWSGSGRYRLWRYFAVWLFGFGAGVWAIVSSPRLTSVVGPEPPPFGLGTYPPWLSFGFERLAYLAPRLSHDALEALIGWLVICTLGVATVWAIRNPTLRQGHYHVRLRYLICWAAGLIVLLPTGTALIAIVLPTLQDTLQPFTNLFPIAVTWTAVIFLVYLHLGDGTTLFLRQIAPYRAIWIVLALVLLSTALAGYIAYRDIRYRVDSHLSGLTLTRESTDQMRAAAQETDLRARLLAQQLETSPTDTAGLGNAFERVKQSLVEIERHVTATHSRARDAMVYVRAAQRRDAEAARSLEPIADALQAALTSTTTLMPTVTTIAQVAAGEPSISRYELLNRLVRRDLLVTTHDVSVKADFLSRSMHSLGFDGLAIFLWIGVLYVVLVLFPWMLHLLFIYRKRRNRAVQILDDLYRLDPSHGLLRRVLAGQSFQGAAPPPGLPSGGAQGQTLDDDVKDLKLNTPGHEFSDSFRRVIAALESRVFSDFEYLLSMGALTLLTAVGWYYVFYPRTAIGLADLIQSGAGVLRISQSIVSNLTPVTLGFAGAYFFVVQMLVRRYLADDLYPAAFTQAALRMVAVFILSLTISVLIGGQPPARTLAAPPTASAAADPADPAAMPAPVTTTTTAASQGPSDGDAQEHSILPLLAAFLCGIFPSSWLRLLAMFVNRGLRTVRPKLNRDIFPDTLIPEPVTRLTGLTVWNESRLLEENIENIQSLATVHIEQLVVGTRFPTAQIVDWIDQAILYLHCGHDGEWYPLLRSVGIRTAYDLLEALVPPKRPLTRHALDRSLAPDPQKLRTIVAAVNSAWSSNVRVAGDRSYVPKEGATLTAAAPAPATSAPASPASAPPPAGVLTEEILHIIFDTVWPDPNMRYIVQFHNEARVAGK